MLWVELEEVLICTQKHASVFERTLGGKYVCSYMNTY